MDTDQKKLVDFIQHTLPIADNTAHEIALNFKPIVFNKNDYLLKQGQISNDYLFLETGFIRAFTYDTEGNDVTTNLYSKNVIVFEVASFFKRTSTSETIQALTDGTGWRVNFDTLQTLFHSIPAFREFGRAILVNGFIALKERTMAMINLTAEQRYEQLLINRPEILQNVPLKYIASYLGITDTSLSRIRKEMMQK